MLIKLWVAFRGQALRIFSARAKQSRRRRRRLLPSYSQTVHLLEARTLPGGSLAHPATPFLAAAALAEPSTTEPDASRKGFAIASHAGGFTSIGTTFRGSSGGRLSPKADTPRTGLRGRSPSEPANSAHEGGNAGAQEKSSPRRSARSKGGRPQDGLAASSGTDRASFARSGRQADHRGSSSNASQTSSPRSTPPEQPAGTASPDMARSVARQVADGNLASAQAKLGQLARRHGTPATNGGNPVDNSNHPSQGGPGQGGPGQNNRGGATPSHPILEQFGHLQNVPQAKAPSPPAGLESDPSASGPAGSGSAGSGFEQHSGGLEPPMMAMSAFSGGSTSNSPIGFYHSRVSPGIEMPTLGAPIATQDQNTFEYAGNNDIHTPQLPGENESFSNVTTYETTTETETGTDADLGDYTRDVHWSTELTRSGNSVSYTETRLKTYSAVTTYVDENGFQSVLTQTGSMNDDFQLTTYIDTQTSDPFARTATSHSESDGYSFTQTWNQTQTDSETGDVTVTSFSFTASGQQSHAAADAHAPDASNPDFSVSAHSAGQNETANLTISLSTTSASGLSTSTTGLVLSGSYGWSKSDGSRQAGGGANAANLGWMNQSVNYGLAMVQEYDYQVAGSSTSLLTHSASGTEVTSRTAEVTPEGDGDPVVVTLTVDADVNFNYRLETSDSYEMTLLGEGGLAATYTYLDGGSLEETILDDSAVMVTSTSNDSNLVLSTDNNVNQNTVWDYSTSSNGAAASGSYSFNMAGETTGSANTSSALSISIEEGGRRSSMAQSSNNQSTILEDEFAYAVSTTATANSLTANVGYSASQEINWSGSESSSHGVEDDSSPDREMRFSASATSSYTDGHDDASVNSTTTMSALADANGNALLEIEVSSNSSSQSTAGFSGTSTSLFELEEPAKNLRYSESAFSFDSNGELASTGSHTGSSTLTVTTQPADVDDDGLIGEGESSATVAYEQIDNLQSQSQSSSDQFNISTTQLEITADTSEAGRTVWMDSQVIAEEQLQLASSSTATNNTTLTVSDTLTSTDGWSETEPVDVDGDGYPDEPPVSETAQVSHVGSSSASSSGGAEGTYGLFTRVEYRDLDHRDNSNWADIDSLSTYTEAGPLSSQSTEDQQLTFGTDGQITANASSSSNSTRSGEYTTSETLTIDAGFYSFATEGLPQEGRGAVGVQPFEVSYLLLYSPQRQNALQVLRDDVTAGVMSGSARTTHTQITYTDNGLLAMSDVASSSSTTVATPNPTPDPGDEDSAYTYSTTASASADSSDSDTKEQFDYNSTTDGTVIEFSTAGLEASPGSGLLLDGLEPTPTSEGALTPTVSAPGGAPINSSLVGGGGVVETSRMNFQDRYQESGEDEAYSQTTSSDVDLLSDGRRKSISQSAMTYSRVADIVAGTNRSGYAGAGASSATEQSDGTTSVTVAAQSLAFSGIAGAAQFSGPGLGAGPTPDRYASESLIVDTASTMRTLGFTSAAGDSQEMAASSTADYLTIAAESSHQEEVSALWASDDGNGGLDQHRYRKIVNNQAGSNSTRYRSKTLSQNRSGVAGGGPVVSASDGLKRDSAIQWSHSDVTIDDDGQVTRTVSDGRSITHLEKRERYVTGLSLGHVSMMTTDHGGSGTVSVTTVSTGGYIGSGGGGRFIVDPDSLFQHVVKTGESNSSHLSTDEFDVGGPVGVEIIRATSGSVEYDLSWTRPLPPEGEEGWPDDPGPVLSVSAYQTSEIRNELRTDDSLEGEPHWTSALSSEMDVSVTESLASGNQVATTVVYTSTTTPFPWTGESPSTGTSTNSGTSDFPVPGLVSGFEQTRDGFDQQGWYYSTSDPVEESPGGAPSLTDTFSAGVSGPVSQVRHAQHGKMRYFANQESTPVEDDIPAEKTTPQLPEEDDCDCQCGDNTGSDGDYFDGSGDWVGDIYGDEIDRRGKVRSAEDVSEYDQENPEATPADWDAFFAGGGGLNLRVDLDMSRFPVARKIAPLSEEAQRLKAMRHSGAELDAIRRRYDAEFEAYMRQAQAERERRYFASVNAEPDSTLLAAASAFWNNGGQAAAGFVPGPAELMDAYMVVDPSSSVFDRSMAGGSLVLSVFSAGLAPNYSGIKGAAQALDATSKQGDKLADGAKAALDATVDAKNAAKETVQCTVENLAEGQRRVTGDALKAMRREFANMKPDAWKKEALLNSQKYTSDQLSAMNLGRAPIGVDGNSMEIHHKLPLAEGGQNLFENFEFLTKTIHRLGPNYKVNHPNLP